MKHQLRGSTFGRDREDNNNNNHSGGVVPESTSSSGRVRESEEYLFQNHPEATGRRWGGTEEEQDEELHFDAEGDSSSLSRKREQVLGTRRGTAACLLTWPDSDPSPAEDQTDASEALVIMAPLSGFNFQRYDTSTSATQKDGLPPSETQTNDFLATESLKAESFPRATSFLLFEVPDEEQPCPALDSRKRILAKACTHPPRCTPEAPFRYTEGSATFGQRVPETPHSSFARLPGAKDSGELERDSEGFFWKCYMEELQCDPKKSGRRHPDKRKAILGTRNGTSGNLSSTGLMEEAQTSSDFTSEVQIVNGTENIGAVFLALDSDDYDA